MCRPVHWTTVVPVGMVNFADGTRRGVARLRAKAEENLRGEEVRPNPGRGQ
jgi:hypothetical protein